MTNHHCLGDASWDIVDDLPLQLATHFIPLVSASSWLASTSIISYALWHEGTAGPGGGKHRWQALLAVTTKYNIFLYDTVKGGRVFHFVKVHSFRPLWFFLKLICEQEFYTPVQPCQLVFVHQSVDITQSQSKIAPPKQTEYGHTDSASLISTPPPTTTVLPPRISCTAHKWPFISCSRRRWGSYASQMWW